MTLLGGGRNTRGGQGHLPYSVAAAPCRTISSRNTSPRGSQDPVWLYLMVAAVAGTFEKGNSGISEQPWPSDLHGDTWCHASLVRTKRNQHMAMEALIVQENWKDLFNSMCGWGRLEFTGEAEISLNKTRKSSMLQKILQRSNALYLKVKSIFTPRYGLRKDVLMLHGWYWLNDYSFQEPCAF